MDHSAPQVPFRNAILRRLPAGVLGLLYRHLRPFKFAIRQTLQTAEDPVQDIYFLESGICSFVVTLKDGRTIETGIVGQEGFVGVQAVLSGGVAPHEAFIQVPGSGYRIEAGFLREQLSEPSGELRAWMLRAVQAQLTQTAQSAACNRVHQIEERLARWLLMCHDRADGDRIPITHDFLATMLGTRRSTVTIAAGILQKAGLIDYKRGEVTVKNRKGLKQASCECYSAVRAEYERLGLV